MRYFTSAHVPRKRSRGAGLGVATLALVVLAGCHHCEVYPAASTVDPTASSTSDGNGVFEPGETVLVEPARHYSSLSRGDCRIGVNCPPTAALTASASDFTGPAGADYSMVDATADYGTITLNRTQSCNSTGDCFLLAVSSPAARPATHWDATFLESPAGVSSPMDGILPMGSPLVETYCRVHAYPYTWTLHIGDSFTDVPRSSSFYKNIETLLHNGIVSGCTPTEYCPGQIVSRAPMATFIARGIAGGDANVPVSGTVNGSAYNCSAGGVSLFTDVAPTDVFCRHVHYLAAQNVMPGCSTTEFCPSDNVNRDGMGGVTAEAIVRPGGDDAVPLSYGPDPGTGLSYSCDAGSPNIHFTDVPVSDPFCKHVHYLWATGITNGCSPTTYCPTDDATREGMSEFIVNAFRLQLYGLGTGIPLPCAPPVITPSGPTTFCAGGSVTLDAGAGYASYLWSPGGQTTQTIVVTNSGNYAVTVTDAGSCQGSSVPITVQVGFDDVPPTDPFYTFVCTLAGDGITAGCGGGNYCRDSAVTRAQMAVFLLKGEHGSSYVPPPATGIFGDVPPGSFAADWIEQLSNEGITAGCGGDNYCPNEPVTRAQMAVFLLKGEHGSSYVPPPAQGIFGDVPAGSFAAAWIEQLHTEGITAGCGGGSYCPGSPNTRGQMAVFLVKTFNLP